MSHPCPTLQICINKEDYEQLNKTARTHLEEFVTICDNIRDGVFKTARAHDLTDTETALLFRTVLIKTAAENSQVRELLHQVTATMGPLEATEV